MIGPNGAEADKKRLLKVTAGNVRHSHVYVNGHYDFFPPECIGGARRSSESQTIEIHLDGLDRTIRTDIGRDAKTGKPRGFFRSRGWVRQFFERHQVKPGALLSLERLSERSYRLSVQHSAQTVPLECAEFFAGIGLVRLALEGQGWPQERAGYLVSHMNASHENQTREMITGKAYAYATAFRRARRRRAWPDSGRPASVDH